MESKEKNIFYTIHDEIDKIVDEGANDFIAIRKLSWNINGKETAPKLNIRRYTHDEKKGTEFSKGFAFITEDGPNNLVNGLLELGYGETRGVIESIKDREDFLDALSYVMGPELDELITVPDDVYKPGLDLLEDE